jgi:hypothetical protein
LNFQTPVGPMNKVYLIGLLAVGDKRIGL